MNFLRCFLLFVIVIAFLASADSCHKQDSNSKAESNIVTTSDVAPEIAIEKTKTFTHQVEGMTIKTIYQALDFAWNHYKITTPKTILMSIEVVEAPEDMEVLIQYNSISIFTKSKIDFFDGQLNFKAIVNQVTNFDDGYLLSKEYPYNVSIVTDGLNKEFLEKWSIFCESGGFAGSVPSDYNLNDRGKIHGCKIQFSTAFLIKYNGEKHYHTQNVIDEFYLQQDN